MRGKNWEGVYYCPLDNVLFTIPADLFYKQPLSDPLSDMKTEYDPRTATILGHEFKKMITDWATFNSSSNDSREWKGSTNKSTAFAITLPLNLYTPGAWSLPERGKGEESE